MTKHHETKPTGAGKSSFGLIDSAKFLLSFSPYFPITIKNT
jgi:hypothetical protein